MPKRRIAESSVADASEPSNRRPSKKPKRTLHRSEPDFGPTLRAPPPSLPADQPQQHEQDFNEHQNQRMQATVYDSVASRVNYEGFIKRGFLNEFKEERVRSGIARPADEVLSRRRRAPDGPVLLAESHDNLPDSDLLVAVHQYASDFYGANGMAKISSRSMDETALIAIGILLEETMRHLLKDSGHLALVDKYGLELYDQEEDAGHKYDQYYDDIVPGDGRTDNGDTD